MSPVNMCRREANGVNYNNYYYFLSTFDMLKSREIQRAAIFQ